MGCLARSCNTPARILKSGDKETKESADTGKSKGDSSFLEKPKEVGSDKE